MGVMTLLDFQTDLISSLQRTPTNPQLTRWINQALKEFGYAFRFHELESLTTFLTVQGKNTYVIGSGQDINVSDLRYIEELRKTAPGITASNPRIGRILPETRSAYLKGVGDTAATTLQGEPLWYHKFGATVYLRPIPDATVTTIELDYYKTITSFVNPTDVSPLHEDWDEAIFLGALYRGFRSFGEYDRWLNIRNEFLTIIRSRQTEFELEEFPEGGISAETGRSDTTLRSESSTSRPWWMGDPPR